MMASPHYKPREFQRETWSYTIHGLVYYRLGYPDKALEHFKIAIKYADEYPNVQGDTSWERALIAMYKTMIIYEQGRHDEAQRYFQDNVHKVRFPKDASQPVLGDTSPSSSNMAVLLALREASRLFQNN